VAAVSLSNEEEIVHIIGIKRGKDRTLARIRDRPRGKPFAEIGIIRRPELEVFPGDLRDPRLGAVYRCRVRLEPHTLLQAVMIHCGDEFPLRRNCFSRSVRCDLCSVNSFARSFAVRNNPVAETIFGIFQLMPLGK
jgi:hypothetical protein